MIKYSISLIFFFFSVFSFAEEVPSVLVSVAPHKFFVERIGGDTITVQLMVPAGASSHTYEPTPKQILSSSKADIWFFLGEAFEAKAMTALRAYHPEIAFYDMRNGVDMITVDPHSSSKCACHVQGYDPHIWLSARQAKIQAAAIARVLSFHYPQNAEKYAQALNEFSKELDELDVKNTSLLTPLKNRTILVSHPAYGYFCRDYNLSQSSIEFEGKDPTPRQITKILEQARALHIKKIFVQPQYSNKGAKLFASEIQADVITLDPYSEHFMDSMLEIASQFSKN